MRNVRSEMKNLPANIQSGDVGIVHWNRGRESWVLGIIRAGYHPYHQSQRRQEYKKRVI